MAVTISTDQDFSTQISANKKVVVKYFADWCGSCKLFSPKFKRLSEDERFKGISFLDINAELNPESRKMANVTNLPYFAVFENGELIEGITTSKEEAFVEFLSKLN